MYTPDEQLIVALKKRDFQEAQRLVDEENADINAKNIRGETPLFFFANAHTLDALNWLLEHGADTEQLNNNGETALFSAVIRNEPLVVDALLNMGANVNTPNSQHISPVFQAVLNEKDLGTLERLLAAAPDLDAASETGTTAVIAAAARKKHNAVKMLIEAGADPEAVDYLGQGLLHAAILSQDTQMVELVTSLVPYLNPNYAARSGTTAMSLTLGFPVMTSRLLSMGGDPNAISGNHMTSKTTLLMGLLSQDPNIDIPLKEKAMEAFQAAMQQAAGQGNVYAEAFDNMLDEMIKAGAHITVRDEKGRNVGSSVINSGALRHLNKLVGHGLDPTRPLSPDSLLPYDALSIKGVDFDNPRVLELIEEWHGLGFPFSRPMWDEQLDGPWTKTIEKNYRPMPTVLELFASMDFWPGVEKILALGANVNEANINGSTLAHALVTWQTDGMSATTKKAIALAMRAKNIDETTKQQQIDELKAEADQRLAALRTQLTQAGIQWDARNSQNDTPLHIAARKGDMSWARYLIEECGVDSTVRNDKGLTPAGEALMVGNAKMYYVLQAAAAAKGQDVASSVLSDTIGASPSEFMERQAWLRAVASLSWTPEQLNACNDDGVTPLCLAAATEQQDAMRTLLKLGADPNLPDQQGNPPVMHAAFQGDSEGIRTLRAGGADPFLPNAQGQTALDVVKYNKNTYAENALSSNDLNEIYNLIAPVEPTDEQKAFAAYQQAVLDNAVRVWNKQEPLPLPELPVKEPVALPTPPPAPAPTAKAPSP